MLTPAERERYSRQIALPQIGEEGQERLRAGSVLVVGAGGLGSPAAIYLAAAGVGRIGLVDSDRVDVSNLHRQILYGTAAIGAPKVLAAQERLQDLNPDVTVETHEERLTPANAARLVARYDVVLDGADNFATRYLLNDVCRRVNKPNVHGSVHRFEGQVSVFCLPDAPCYRCLYPEPPPPHLSPSCAEGGVLGVLPGIVGSVQAAEAMKLITGAGRTLAGRLLLIDALRMTFRSVILEQRCSTHPDSNPADYEENCMTTNNTEITPADVARRIGAGDPLLLVDVREPYEWNAGHVEGAVHIPLGQLTARQSELDPSREIVMICRSGGRSEHARQYLRQQGFERVWNLTGGMQRWAREVDPSIRVA